MTVRVLPLPLMHLTAAVVAASTHAEAGGDDGREDHEHDSKDAADQESRLIVDPLQRDKMVRQCTVRLRLRVKCEE